MTADTPTIRQLAEAEAARAEAEGDDDDDEAAADEEGTPPSEPDVPAEQPSEPPPEPVTEAQLKKMTERLDKEDERHKNRYAEVLGDQFAEMGPCPRCLTRGFIYSPDKFPVPDEQVAAVQASLGLLAEPELLEATDAVRCEACDGWGMVKTGAQNEQGAIKACTRCAGQGWVAPSPAAPVATFTSSAPLRENGSPDDEYASAMPDAWGRPVGHPHWGQDPATIGV
jgi:hypothetical protein